MEQTASATDPGGVPTLSSGAFRGFAGWARPGSTEIEGTGRKRLLHCFLPFCHRAPGRYSPGALAWNFPRQALQHPGLGETICGVFWYLLWFVPHPFSACPTSFRELSYLQPSSLSGFNSGLVMHVWLMRTLSQKALGYWEMSPHGPSGGILAER